MAQYYVGKCYQFGNGTAKNEKLAFEYYKKTANKNFILGEFQVGYCYDKGIGIEKMQSWLNIGMKRLQVMDI